MLISLSKLYINLCCGRNYCSTQCDVSQALIVTKISYNMTSPSTETFYCFIKHIFYNCHNFTVFYFFRNHWFALVITITIFSVNSLSVQVHDMEFAPSLDMIISETLPALQKVFALNWCFTIIILNMVICLPITSARFLSEVLRIVTKIVQ